MDQEKVTLGKKLAAARKRSKLTQRAVSNHFGYTTPQFVSNWERGITVPPLETLKELGGLYGCSIKKLIQEYERKKINRLFGE